MGSLQKKDREWLIQLAKQAEGLLNNKRPS